MRFSSLIKQKILEYPPDQLVDETSKWHQEFTRTLYSRLEEAMRAYNAVDFDRLLSLSVALFEGHPDVLERYQERYRYIMIDEYQDTNPIQYRLAELLSAKYGNLCVVGDDDQSIYGWRGANMRNILDFGCQTTIKLEQNYRSTTTILRAANAVIGNNTERHKKVLWSDCGVGNPIEVFVAPGEVEEAEGVALRIAKLREYKQAAWSDIAILYRSNSLSRQIEKALLKQPWHDGTRWVIGIPYRIHGGTEFYERKEVKDIFAYLRLIANPADQEALLRIINQPRRGIGEGGLDRITSFSRTQGISLWNLLESICSESCSIGDLQTTLTAKFKSGLSDFMSIIKESQQKFATLPLHEALKWLIDRIDYKRAIQEEVKSKQMRAFKEENVEEFVNAIAEYATNKILEEQIPTLQDFITQLPLDKEGAFNRAQRDKNEERVSLMTFHSAKGLEFPTCFLVGVEKGIIPHSKSMEGTGIEEERRLMYVAITRAMRNLIISMSIKRMRMGKEEPGSPSPFLYEIPEDCYIRSNWKTTNTNY
jgi:DNA helicase-2/ATP-dependent DNA helicase PcrA